MTRYRWILLLVFLVTAIRVSAQAADSVKLTEEDFVLVDSQGRKAAGFDFPAGALIELFGDPVISVGYENQRDPAWTRLVYTWDQIIVDVFQGSGKMNKMLLLSKSLKTKRGITVGDTGKRVRERYGDPMGENAEEIWYSLPTEDSRWIISFYLEKDYIHKIVISRHP